MSHIFIIPGCPVPWAASRIGRRGAVDPKAHDKVNIVWMIKLQAQKMLVHWPLKGPIRLTLIFFMQISHTRRIRKGNQIDPLLEHHLCKPDNTNLCKLYEDMLQRAGVIKNDSMVVHTEIMKFFGDKPRTVIRVEQVLGYPKPPDWA